MQKGDLGFVLGLAGFLLGGWALVLSLPAPGRLDALEDVMSGDNESFAGLGERVEKLDSAQKDLARRVNSLDLNPRTFEDRMRMLEERVATLESSAGAAAPGAKDTELAPRAADPKRDAEEFQALQDKVFTGTATPDEQARFWALLREKPQILADILASLEKAVADAPENVDGRMRLSRAYLAKLFTVPDGPEKGVWAMKAMDQYGKVLERDAEHWEARYSLAMSYSQFPDFLNKRPDAIREFETLKKQQEQRTPEPQYAQTYLQLRQLYLKDGRTDDAKAVLEEGRRRFPDDEELKKASEGAK
jgi:tetratricopeptide (TPR) repeat protein